MKLDRPPFVNFKPGDFPDPSQFDVIELKYDGWWGQLLIEYGFWQIYSRTGLLKKEGRFDPDVGKTVIHAEFLYGTEWAKDRPELYEKLACHTIVELDGVDVSNSPNGSMRDTLRSFLKLCQHEEIIQRCFVVKQFPVEIGQKVWKKFVEGKKFEGLIFKHSESAWGAEMGRMKQVATMDYVCMDVLESDSVTYAGWGARCIVGGLYVDGKLVKRCNIPGMTNEQRREFLQNKDKYIGRVLECAGKKVSKRGAVRHPEFIRWRDDKSSEDCTWPE